MFRKRIRKKKKFSTKCSKFDINEFADYYDSLSVDEWQVVIADAKKFGYDIRCVLMYKSWYGEDFTIRVIDEVFYPLLWMNHCESYVMSVDPPEWFFNKDGFRDRTERQYKQWDLPVPEYWRERLWT